MYIHYFKIIDSKKKRLWLNVAHLKMNKWDTWAEPLVTPQLISVQDFAFRGRPLSLLVAFPAGGFFLPSNQLLEGSEQVKPTFTLTKKTNH